MIRFDLLAMLNRYEVCGASSEVLICDQDFPCGSPVAWPLHAIWDRANNLRLAGIHGLARHDVTIPRKAVSKMYVSLTRFFSLGTGTRVRHC